ncbi:hypothetical protein GCM10010335_44920 [Streptomyces galbus]|nr:hypothetical protein GCM10010335_44920 [Streptomyces galbus]
MDANARQGVRPAPGGLSFVQAFLNTEGGGRSDLLADAATANTWYAFAYAAVIGEQSVVGADTPTPAVLSHHDARRLSVLRSRIKSARKHPSGDRGPQCTEATIPAATVTLRQSGELAVSVTPCGTGCSQVESLLAFECLVAQLSDEWRRLKVCRDAGCRVAFYDRSRNSSRVWHDVRTCGNAANLRASRARHRKDTGTAHCQST